MKKSVLFLLGLGALISASTGAFAQADIAVSIGQPGFYGNINIGSAPPPVTVYPQPILVQPTAVPLEPIYLRVPAEHYRHWPMYCQRYNACGRPVHFVNDEWYNSVYAPHYHSHRGDYERYEHFERSERGEHWHERHDERREDRRDDRREDRRDERYGR